MPAGPTIVAKFMADTSNLTSEVDKAASGSESKLTNFAKNAALAIGGAFAVAKVVEFGKASVQAASEDAAAQAQLAAALKNTTGATDAQVAGAEKFISNLSKQAAIADDDLRPALATLARGFGDTEKAQQALSIATDVAAGTGKDLSTVTEAMMKAAQGNTGALGRLGIATKDASGNALSLDQIMDNMATTFKGQAAVAADSTAGKMRSAQIAFGEFQEQIGTALLPVIGTLSSFLTDTLIPAIGAVADFIGSHKEVIAAALIGIGVVVGTIVIPAFIAWAAAAGTAAIATLAAAAPFIAIAAVIAAVAFLIIHNWDTIVAATKAAWDAIVGAVQFVWNWIKDNWPLLLTIITGPIGAAVALVIKHWDTIKAAATAVWQWVVDKWNAITGAISSAVGTIGNLMGNIAAVFGRVKDAATDVYNWVASKFQAIADAISNVVSAVTGAIGRVVNAIKAPINALIGAWNGLEFRIPTIKLPSFGGLSVLGKTVIPGFEGPTLGGQTIGFPDLPKLATGGLTLSEGLAWLHPAEVVAPLDQVGVGGPAVHIENATFTSAVDVDLLMDRVAWAMRTRTA
jgi:hypothetical protein